MPIFVEARNISGLGGVAGGHMYLVYVPLGSENDYDAWQTIGVFPEVSSSTGPWGLIDADRTGSSQLPGNSGGEMRGAVDDYILEIDGADVSTYEPTPQELADLAGDRGRQTARCGPVFCVG